MKNYIIGALACLAAGANAQSIYSTNFDNWSAGTNGTSVTASANAGQGWDPTSAGATIVANGQTNAGGVTALSGNQMLRMTVGNSSTASNFAWKDISGAWASRASGNNVVHSSVSFFIPTGNNRSTYYGLAAYSTNVDLLAELVFQPNYDSTNSSLFFDNGTDGVGWTIPKTSMRGAWNKLDMYLDFDNLIGEALLTVGTTTLDLGGFALDPTAAANPLGDIDFFAGNSSSQTGTSAAATSVYFDNFSIEATNHVVPEPATMAALGFGAFGMIARRRRKK